MEPPVVHLCGIQCGFCLGKDEELVTPKSLPCGHIHCLRCLETDYSLTHMIKCPFCRGTYPEITADGLPSAFQRNDESALCDKCKEKKYKGITLDRFCSTCNRIAYANHQKELLEKKLNAVRYCDQHKESVYTSGCELCYKPLCTDCIHGDDVCSNGERHVVLALDELVEGVKQKLKHLEGKVNSLDELCKQAECEISKLEESQEIFKHLDRQYDLQLERLELQHLKQKRDLFEERTHSKSRMYAFIEDEILVELADVWKMRVRLGTLLQFHSQTEAISSYGKMKDCINDLLCRQVPTFNVDGNSAETTDSSTESSFEGQEEYIDTDAESLNSDIIPLEVFEAISELCSDYSVENMEFSYDPNDSNHILIIGKNAGEIPPNKINKLLADTRFIASTHEMESAIHTNPMVNQIARKSEQDICPHKQMGTMGCDVCYTLLCSQCIGESDLCRNGEPHYLLPVKDLVNTLSYTHILLKKREGQLMHLYREHHHKLSNFEHETRELVEHLQVKFSAEQEQQVRFIGKKYSKLKEEEQQKRNKAITELNQFADDIEGKKIQLIWRIIRKLQAQITGSHMVDIINEFARLKCSVQTALSETLPRFPVPDWDYTEYSDCLTEYSLEDQEEFADEESESSGSDVIPLEVFDGISMLCRKYAVDDVEFSYDPDNANHLLIIGKNAGNIPLDKIDELVKDGRFTITPKEVESPVHTVTMMDPILTMTQKKRDGNDWCDSSVSACELLLHSVDRNREENEKEELGYLAGPAHMVLDETQRQEFCCADNILHARYDVEKISTQNRFIAKLTDENCCLDIGHPPLLCYKYWCSGQPLLEAQTEEQLDCSCRKLDIIMERMGSPGRIQYAFEKGDFDKIPICEHIVLSDILLLSLHPTKAVELWEKFRQRSEFRSSALYRVPFIGDLRKMSRNNCEIRIGCYEGQLRKLGLQYRQVQNEQTGRIHHYIQGLHIQFKLNSNKDKLVEGDCGHIVFLKQEGKYRPLGMLIGSIAKNDQVYRAILIHQGLQELELDYPHHLSRVRLINQRFAQKVRDQRERQVSAAPIGESQAEIP